MTTAKKPTKQHGFRYCETCGKKLVKNGKENGKQRWRCLVCGTARIRARQDVATRNRQKTLEKHLLSKGTAEDAAKSKHISRRTFDRRYVAGLPSSPGAPPPTPPTPTPPPTPTHQAIDKTVKDSVSTEAYLVVDATSLSSGVVAIARSASGTLRWCYAAWESSSVWERVFFRFRSSTVLAVVSDGQKGIQKAARLVFGDVILQRCHFHVKRNLRVKLTLHPMVAAGQDLQLLAHWLSSVRTYDDMALFVGAFYGLTEAYEAFLKERTYYTDVHGRKRWNYTHPRVRSAYRQIATLIEDDQLFAYITHPELDLPTTTNHVEGGLNTRVAELLRSHRGMRYVRQKQLIDTFLHSKQTIQLQHGKMTKAGRKQQRRILDQPTHTTTPPPPKQPPANAAG